VIVELRESSTDSPSALDADSLLERYRLQKSGLLGSFSPGEVQILQEYSHLPMLLLQLSNSDTLRRLVTADSVSAVYEDKTISRLLAQSLPLIGQPSVASAGYRGSGTTIAVIDSGVDYTRSAFGNCTSPGNPTGCKVAVSLDIAPSDGTLDDTTLHGTNVAAIALGVAPDSRIAALDVFNGEFSNDSTVIAAVNWCIANRDLYNIVAMNISLGSGGSTRPCDSSPFATPFRTARQARILPVVAAGNDATSTEIKEPACVPGAVSVGAVYDSNVGPINWSSCTDSSTAADRVTCFSSAYSSLTLFAPGALITAAGLTYGGTSQASPHVAGAAALLRAAFPSETMLTTVSRLVSSPTQVADWRDGRVKPRLNLSDAVFGAAPPCTTHALALPASFSTSLQSTDCHNGSDDTLELFYNDLYTFQGTAGQTITVQMNSSSFNTWAGLVAPSNPNSFAATNDSASGATRSSRIVYTLPESGTWTLYASSSYGGETGGYGLFVGTGTTQTGCIPNPATLCLNGGRFRAQVTWRAQNIGQSGNGTGVSLSGDTGYFWFFSSSNVELVVKVLDGRAFNNKFWVFFGALSDVEYTLIVTDTVSGAVKTYFNPQGRLASIADTSAF